VGLLNLVVVTDGLAEVSVLVGVQNRRREPSRHRRPVGASSNWIDEFRASGGSLALTELDRGEPQETS
jgi:hypothetical protein